MKKEFIVIAFESDKHGYKVLKYDTADYAGASDSIWYQIIRNRDDVVVLMIPVSRVFYVRLVEDREEN